MLLQNMLKALKHYFFNIDLIMDVDIDMGMDMDVARDMDIDM
jgi:hypothetical protein